MKIICTALLFGLLFSCGNEQKEFCACLKSGEKLNEFSSNHIDKVISEDDAIQLKELIQAKRKNCAAFKEMTGPEMMELKKTCR